MLQIYFVKLGDQFRGKLAASHHLTKAIFILEHDVQGQLKRPGILAANQLSKLPELAHLVTLPSVTNSRTSCETAYRDHRDATHDWRKSDTRGPCRRPAAKMERPDY